MILHVFSWDQLARIWEFIVGFFKFLWGLLRFSAEAAEAVQPIPAPETNKAPRAGPCFVRTRRGSGVAPVVVVAAEV